MVVYAFIFFVYLLIFACVLLGQYPTYWILARMSVQADTQRSQNYMSN